MDRKRLVKILAPLIFFLFIAQLLATKFYWYYSIWYFDMPMHFLGGFWSGLFVIWVLSDGNLSHRLSVKLIFNILFFVLLIGVLWEIFEFSANNYFVKNLFLANSLDSISDIFFDLAGGIVAVLYFLKKIMRTHENEVQSL